MKAKPRKTKLSVNINKIALLRNARGGAIPDILEASRVIVESGADGITVHPRPDARHIRTEDILALAKLTRKYGVEFNIEGNPFAQRNENYPGFIQLVEAAKPNQATLVPDSEEQLTSDHGWNLAGSRDALEKTIQRLASSCNRVSLFMDAKSQEWPLAKALQANRVELYTEAYASSYPSAHKQRVLSQYKVAAQLALAAGLELNAGHDLNQENLAAFLEEIPCISEVSIGHALINEALYDGLRKTVQAYKNICQQCFLKNSLPV